MICAHDLVLGNPVTLWGKTIVPVVRMVRFRGAWGGMTSGEPVAVLVVIEDCCWFAPLDEKFREAELSEALIPALNGRNKG